jgi:hypothetical protein
MLDGSVLNVLLLAGALEGQRQLAVASAAAATG